MSPDLILVAVVGVLFAAGVTLLLERSLSRVLIGIIMLGNGVNLLLLLGGRSGDAPILGVTPAGGMSDPLPQAMVLTAIVITLGLTAFLLAMAYRSWQLTGHDEVRDDPEDRQIVRRAERDESSVPDDLDVGVRPWAEPTGRTEEADPEQVDPEPGPRRLDREADDA
ncbi:Na(+)/H(+) antiporter subunit C [Plantactinospora sp. S1510]|uniref:Na(+)/H(+) antiporter subunit C n=1 Tax=Plantactinospora alkalitolerans TaxID=2789879 RepID=A0ABS0GRV3_9ACTN|nr:Na(+)/H(+) antiporter subunit C [Plantactinospora alkalitolerans]MBF9128921.1 Na(+)/H(+) antiporter subunit C [Plantactinospora alkalitolerans]